MEGMKDSRMRLDPRKKYLQTAFNRSMTEVLLMIAKLPSSDRILIEAGTPFIKQYGAKGVQVLRTAWNLKLGKSGYIVADLKTMDRGGKEVEIFAQAGASAVTCLGLAPTETINELIRQCEDSGIDSMVDMMNVEFPFEVLRKLKKLPKVVVLHRGVDEGQGKNAKILPHQEINRIKGAYGHLLISIAGGETERDVVRTYFNGADIAVVWRQFAEMPDQTSDLAKSFLKLIK